MLSIDRCEAKSVRRWAEVLGEDYQKLLRCIKKKKKEGILGAMG